MGELMTRDLLAGPGEVAPRPSASPLTGGRDAQVWRVDEQRVVRRLARAADAEFEARVMIYAHSHGVPTPRVHDVTGCDIQMEYVPGVSMLDALVQDPRTFVNHARALADLHERLHSIEVPSWLPAGGYPATALLHLDLQPGNVLLGERGPVLIDWSNASVGPPSLDVAVTWLSIALKGTGQLGASQLHDARQTFLAAFLRRFDRAAVVRELSRGVAFLLADPLITDEERRAVVAVRDDLQQLEGRIPGRRWARGGASDARIGCPDVEDC